MRSFGEQDWREAFCDASSQDANSKNTDQVYDAAAKTAFLISEARGLGDYELMDDPAIVESYDVAFPEWPLDFLHEVQSNIHTLTSQRASELSHGLIGSIEEQTASLEEMRRMIESEATAISDRR